MLDYLIWDILGFCVEITSIDGQVGRGGGELDPLSRLNTVHNPVTEVDIRDRVVVVGRVVVGDKEVDVKASEVHLTNSKALAAKPVAMEQLVWVAVQPKLMESDILYLHLGEDGSPSANYSIVKVVRVRKLT